MIALELSKSTIGVHANSLTIIAKPLGSKFSDDDEHEILTWRKALLKQVKSYTDDNLNHTKVNVIGPTKGSFS